MGTTPSIPQASLITDAFDTAATVSASRIAIRLSILRGGGGGTARYGGGGSASRPGYVPVKALSSRALVSALYADTAPNAC